MMAPFLKIRVQEAIEKRSNNSITACASRVAFKISESMDRFWVMCVVYRFAGALGAGICQMCHKLISAEINFLVKMCRDLSISNQDYFCRSSYGVFYWMAVLCANRMPAGYRRIFYA